MLACTTTNYLYTKQPLPKQSEVIDLLRPLSMTTEWVTVAVVGPDSDLRPGDEALISARPASFNFQIDGVQMFNLDDKATIAYRHNDELRCTNGTMLLEKPIEPEDRYSAGGILLSTMKPKNETIWLRVAAAGPKAGVSAGDEVLVKEETTAYTININGQLYRNAGSEEIIAYRTTAM